MNPKSETQKLMRASIVSRLREGGSVFAEEEAAVLISEAGSVGELEDMVVRRIHGTPLEHVVGWVEFFGRRYAVQPSVFVPRRRSELLVTEALRLIHSGDTVIDLCCGSGALGASIMHHARDIEIFASDIDPAAVACARANLGRGGGKVFKSDLFSSFPMSLERRIDVILCNAPYVPSDSLDFLPVDARLHEPLHTLDGGYDGLEVHRRVLNESKKWLSHGGYLLLETSQYQVELLQRLFEDAGFVPRVATSEDLDATVIIGTLMSNEAFS